MSNLKKILQKLGLNASNGLYFFNEKWEKEVSLPNRIKRIFEGKLKPTAFFCVDNKPLILFFENPLDKEELHRKIWNFNESPIIIIIEDSVVEIFNGFKITESQSGLLEKIGGYEKLDDFNYFELVTGQAWEKYQEEFRYQNRIDYKLLSDIRDARNLILETFRKTTDKEQEKLYKKIANALLGKIIFTRYLIDRKVELNFEDNAMTWTNDDLCNLLKNHKKTKLFFDYLADHQKGFNGDLFPLAPKEYSMISKDILRIIIRLLKSEDIGTGQLSLFDLYDFSIIPVEFISNVYESFIGVENQAEGGVYYTPLFLVDYILSETITKAIECGGNADCKILDPACGSGVFLVETLRKLIEKFIVSNEGDANKTRRFKERIADIAKNNIFGIDKDESAIQVAIFSVYLTLLDYMEPPEISSFKFPNLLDNNFFHDDFFNTEAFFNEKFKSECFSFIIGNPPWKRGNIEENLLFNKYIRERKLKEKSNGEPLVNIGNKEIAQAFLLRCSDFSTEKTKCALIVTSKVLYNLQSVNFRKYFLHNYFIDHVFELAPVRREVFNKSSDKAISPACVLFFNYAHGKNTDQNIIRHIALKPSRFFILFKIFAITRQDIQYVQQKKLKKDDWMWKVLVYGSYLDFNLIKRFKTEYDSIENSFDENTLISQGIKRVDGEKKIDASQLCGYDFLDLGKKEIRQFYISPNHAKWDLKEVGYVFREKGNICEDIFSPPMLLIKETVNPALESISAVSTQKLVFTDKTTSIKFRGDRSIDDYYLLAGLMNSSIFAYYVFQASSTAGIMIEQQINDVERFSFPFVYSSTIIQYAKEIELLEKEADFVLSQDKQKEINTRKQKIALIMSELLSLNHIEQSLIDYSRDIMIPMAMKKEHNYLFLPCAFKDNILQEYAKLFIDRFGDKFKSINRRMVVEIWYTKQVIGMFFNLAKEEKSKIIWKNIENDISGMLKLIIGLSGKKITEKLFILKDVRGFGEEGFYIFKPNEKYLWHKAIGYLDADEFAEALHKAEK